MKKYYIQPIIQTVELPGKGILTIAASGEDTYSVQELDTDALNGEGQNDNNTLTGDEDFL